MRRLMLAMLLAGAMLAPGCLVGETTHTLYLDPDGGVTWVVMEHAVRSDAQDDAERGREEDEFLGQAWKAEHPVARALESLGPSEMQVDVLRPRRPFTVVSEARFRAVDDLARAFLAGIGVRAEVRLERLGDQMHLALLLEEGDEEGAEDSDVLLSLVGDADDYRFALTEGRFVDAEGFTVSEDGAVAVPEADACDEDDRCSLSLTWEAD
jgi:hypothetical protein